MNIYHYTPDLGLYCGMDLADESPLEPGVYLIPAYATELEPPMPGENQMVKFVDGAWTLETVDIPVVETIVEPTVEELAAAAKAKALADIDAVYQPQITDLIDSVMMATLSNDTAAIAAAQASYATLKAEYDTKKAAV